MSDSNEVGWLRPLQLLAGDLGDVSYTAARGQTYDEWCRDGKRLSIVNTATRWALGDWMNAGGVFKDDARWQAEVISTRPLHFWNEAMRVSSCVPVANRRPELAWYFHQVVAALDPQEQRLLLDQCIEHEWDLDQLRAHTALVRNGHTPLEIERSNEAAAAYRAAKEGTPDTAPVRKIDDLTKEAREAKKAAALVKYQERRDLQERKAAEVVERRAAEARGERLPPRVVIPEPEGVHNVLVADPWRDQGTTLTDAVALPFLDLIADDALMFMWTQRIERLPDSLALLEAWGFDYRSRMIWRRTRATMTDYVREGDELILIGKRGQPRKPAERERPPSVFDAPGGQGEHPAIFLQILEKMYPHAKRLVVLPTGELPRSHRDKWAVWDGPPKGDQRAAVIAVDNRREEEPDAHPTFERSLLGARAAAAARDGDRLPD